MANKKITDLPEASSVANNDWLVIVDTANDETKKVHASEVGGNIPIQGTAPTSPETNDLWIDTSDDNRLKYFDGTNWVDVSDNVAGDTMPIGSIVPYGSSTAPTNWLVCDGSAVSRTTYSELFAVIGTSYGAGDGSTTFNLPNLKGKVPVGQDTSDTSFDVMGETGGEKKHTLTLQEMPSHEHNVRLASSAGGSVATMAAVQPKWDWNGTSTLVHGVAAAVGGNQPHNNLQPYQVVCYIIKAGQSAGVLANVSNAESNSQTDTYSCNYSNSMFDFLRTNKTILPEGQSANCLMMDDVTTKNIMLYYNPINAPEPNKMVMWTAFFTDNNNPDSYWTYIALAITLDDHKLWVNGYHNATQSWAGWQQL